MELAASAVPRSHCLHSRMLFGPDAPSPTPNMPDLSEFFLTSSLRGDERRGQSGAAHGNQTERHRHPKVAPIRRVLSHAVSCVVYLLVLLTGFWLGYLWRDETSCRLRFSEAPAAPATSTVKVTFREEPLYVGAVSDASNTAWESLIPKGRGFVEVDSSGKKERYCVSVFHQLHCLDMLRRGYHAALELARNNTPIAEGEQPHVDTMALPHTQHCFDYIRQGLMCAADPTLEKRNDTIGGVTGWGTSHQCRDFNALQEWAETHRYSDGI
ncbi:hypothetical protein F5Y14DRAFT_226701 [Nemania sp. NC0429]|nr:hypothetical protein F5Y14DRAFT_226701 [Nemania sp. NC0429]